MANNLVKEWSEFNKLQECPSLEDLLFVGLYKIPFGIKANFSTNKFTEYR